MTDTPDVKTLQTEIENLKNRVQELEQKKDHRTSLVSQSQPPEQPEKAGTFEFKGKTFQRGPIVSDEWGTRLKIQHVTEEANGPLLDCEPAPQPNAISDERLAHLIAMHIGLTSEEGADIEKALRELQHRRADQLADDERIENAKQAMSETHSSWESRCHAIMAALGIDYGRMNEFLPDEDPPNSMQVTELAQHLLWFYRRGTVADAHEAWQALEVALTQPTLQKSTGFFATLTPEQKKQVLAYKGDDTVGENLQAIEPSLDIKPIEWVEVTPEEGTLQGSGYTICFEVDEIHGETYSIWRGNIIPEIGFAVTISEAKSIAEADRQKRIQQAASNMAIWEDESGELHFQKPTEGSATIVYKG